MAKNDAPSCPSPSSSCCPELPPPWHDLFLEMLPAIRRHAEISFRQLSGDNRDDAVQEVICSACTAYARLVEQGRAGAATWSTLALFAVQQYHAGRRVGRSLNVHDVLSPYCQRRKQLRVERLHDHEGSGEPWQEILVEDKRATPADLAASRIDFPAWLSTLSDRDRRIAMKLASGESARRVAHTFCISAARVSQLRRALEEAWHEFHCDGFEADAVVRTRHF